jgi:hypothetical protein
MSKDNIQSDTVKYTPGRLTLLQLMGALALLGIFLTVILRYFFT